MHRSVDQHSHTHRSAAEAVWAIDGPQGLAKHGARLRACERALATPGKTSHELPPPQSGQQPFGDYVRSSVDLFAALLQMNALHLVGLNGRSLTDATLFEVFPGAEWKVLTATALPKKTGASGRRLRIELLRKLGIHDVPDGISADLCDAAIAAYLAWCTRHRPEDVIAALDALTKRPAETYDAFVERLAHNPIALRVKLADLADNLDTTRLRELTDEDLQRIRKYHRARRRLLQLRDPATASETTDEHG